MSNGFEALAPLADKLKTNARRRQAEEQARQEASEHIARETNVFLDVMKKTGVKAAGGVKIKPRITEKDIDFAGAMKKAGVTPLGAGDRVTHKKPRKAVPAQTIADNKRVLAESMSDDLDSIEFLESEDGKSFRRPGIGPDVPRDLRRISQKRPPPRAVLRAHHSRQGQRHARPYRHFARSRAPLAQAARRSRRVLRAARN